MKRFDWKGSLAKAFGKSATQITIRHPATGEQGVIYSRSELRNLIEEAYEAGANDQYQYADGADKNSRDQYTNLVTESI